MGMLSQWFGGDRPGEEMARAKTRPLQTAKIEFYVAQLRLSLKDAAKFKAAIACLGADESLSAADIVEISRQFVGGQRPKSRAAALSAIGRRRLELTHANAKGDIAAKTRVW